MKNLLKLEEALQLGLCIFALFTFKSPWWYYLLLALGPDLSMLGYLGGNKTGAVCYNFFHHKAVAIVLIIAGWWLGNHVCLVSGIILLGHSSMDRMFGYGLKLEQGFRYTHLGIIGKTRN
jgi:hypothetical protein